MLILSLMLFSAVVFAGGQSGRGTPSSSATGYQRDPNLNAPGTFPINKQRVSLKIGVEGNAMIEDWETNWYTRQIEEKGNYDLSFEVYPAGEMNQKVELMVMAGGTDLPDVLLGHFSIISVTRYGQAGMIIPIQDYYENIAYWSKEASKKLEIDPLKYITSYDGNIYGMFQINTALNNQYSPSRIMIYEPWLQKLGLELPQTIDEFVNILRAFRDRDPNGNGQKDEMPLIGHRGNMENSYLYALMMPFIYTQQDFWMWNNEKIDVSFNKPGWRDGLQYTKQLIDEGLLSPLSFTQDQAQMTALISPDPPKVGAVIRISSSNLGANDYKRMEYIIVPPLAGPAGRESLWTPPMPSISMLITKNCKNPESAFMMGDFLGNEEMSRATYAGERGVDWDLPGPNDKSHYDSLGIKPNYRTINQIWGINQNKHWAQTGPVIQTDFQEVSGVSPIEYLAPIGRTIEPSIRYANRNPIFGIIYNEEEQEIMAELHSTILSYVQESFARFVTGDLSIDRDWDSYVAEFNKMGLADVIRVTQSAYDRMNKQTDR
jgi:putative aldouronate transport system substrate-binding protein